ncbi:hypothetical protein PoB_000544300 [Plakobranchus ocellatus]|uniref:Uncharacterized protein n=1 Tax=Plakobranchus ocellatus TaxID=259542 RepID=A0AAV3Y9W2_9GAST|nr:hypothetical protein PoB_000544300 [Plakobranchus ocellatus]
MLLDYFSQSFQPKAGDRTVTDDMFLAHNSSLGDVLHICCDQAKPSPEPGRRVDIYHEAVVMLQSSISPRNSQSFSISGSNPSVQG